MVSCRPSFVTAFLPSLCVTKVAGCAISLLSCLRLPVARRAARWLLRAARRTHDSPPRPKHYVLIMVSRMEFVFVDATQCCCYPCSFPLRVLLTSGDAQRALRCCCLSLFSTYYSFNILVAIYSLMLLSLSTLDASSQSMSTSFIPTLVASWEL